MKKLILLISLFVWCSTSLLAQYSIEVGSYDYLSLDPPAGYVRSATWSCDEGLALTESSEAGAVVKVTHYFSGAAYVNCSYVYEYLGSYDGNYHAGRGTKTYRITCVAGTARISETNLNLDIGRTYTLKCIKSSSYGTPIWTSSDENVVTVNENGKVKAIGPGVATITLDPIVADLCFCEVRVNKIDPTAIEMVSDRLTLKEGDKGSLSYKFVPSGATADVYWKSSDESIAKVSSNGQITALGEGTAKITVSTDNGLSASATVEVVPLPRQVSLITPQPLTIGYGWRLEPALTPSNAITSYTWISEDPTVATVDATGRVKGRTTGTATITVTTENGKTASCRLTVKSPSQGMEYRNAAIRIKAFKDVVKRSLNNIK